MSNRNFTALICSFLLLITSCGKPANAGETYFTIRMERDLCDGDCPAYALTIYSDGSVSYEGYRYVELEGRGQTKLSKEQVQDLAERINQSNMFTTNQGCCRSSTTKGAPSVTITMDINGQSSYVGYILSDGTKIPVELRQLECYIDEITNSAQWTGGHPYCENILE